VVTQKSKTAAKKATLSTTARKPIVKPKATEIASTKSAKKAVAKKTEENKVEKKVTLAKSKTTNAATAKKAAKPATKKVVEKKQASATSKTAEVKKPAVTKAKSAVGKSKSAAKRATRKSKSTIPSPEQRHIMVRTAAYFIAEKNGFLGRPEDHWLVAEYEISSILGEQESFGSS